MRQPLSLHLHNWVRLHLLFKKRLPELPTHSLPTLKGVVWSKINTHQESIEPNSVPKSASLKPPACKQTARRQKQIIKKKEKKEEKKKKKRRKKEEEKKKKRRKKEKKRKKKKKKGQERKRKEKKPLKQRSGKRAQNDRSTSKNSLIHSKKYLLAFTSIPHAHSSSHFPITSLISIIPRLSQVRYPTLIPECTTTRTKPAQLTVYPMDTEKHIPKAR